MNRELYRQDGFPIFQNRMYDSREEARSCPRGDIRIIEDGATGMIYNTAFNVASIDYDSAYQNEQAGSPTFQSHLDEIMALVARTMQGSLVEVGCGKGFFLDALLAEGFDVVGFDPAYEGDNPNVKREYFSEGIGYTGDGLVLRHVLEHIQDPYGFLTQLARANGGQGLIYIEVPCFDWICTQKSWYDIFYEHVNYFRLRDFEAMFGRLVHGARSFNGQYLSIVGDLATLRPPVYDPACAIDFPDDFLDRLSEDVAFKDSQLTVWGGASKGVIFSLLRERAGLPLPTVIDINPAKQGKFLPATGIEVAAPESRMNELEDGAPILVMNPNYMDEIKSMSRNRFNYMSLTND